MADGKLGKQAEKHQYQSVARIENVTDCLLDSSVEILFDTLAIEDVITLCFDGVLDHVVAEAADHRLSVVLDQEFTLIILAPQDEIRMASHLTHTRKQTEDV